MYETIIPAVCLQYSSICKEAEISVESDPARTIAVDDAIGSKLAVNIIGQDVSSTFDPESNGLAPSFYTLLDPAATIIRSLTAICFERNIGSVGTSPCMVRHSVALILVKPCHRQIIH